MTLDDMCQMAARYSDRFDEMPKTQQADDTMGYSGEAESFFNIFRDAINEAYSEISRTRLMPDRYVPVTVPDDRVLAIKDLAPEASSICGVYSADRGRQYPFNYVTRFELELPDAQPGDELLIHIHYLPQPLSELTDEPIFPDSLVEPMVYVSLAVARMWQSERKLTAAQSWMSEYYHLLRTVRPGLDNAAKRRFPRPVFR